MSLNSPEDFSVATGFSQSLYFGVDEHAELYLPPVALSD